MDSQLRQALKAKAHHLKPVIIMGAKGLTAAVVEETDHALTAHELIKVKINGEEKTIRQQIASALAEQLQAEVIQLIGNTVILYRKRVES